MAGGMMIYCGRHPSKDNKLPNWHKERLIVTTDDNGQEEVIEVAKIPEEYTVQLKLDTEVFTEQLMAVRDCLSFTLETVREASEPKKRSLWQRIKRKVAR